MNYLDGTTAQKPNAAALVAQKRDEAGAYDDMLTGPNDPITPPLEPAEEPPTTPQTGGRVDCTMCAYPATTLDETGKHPLCVSCKADEAEYIDARDNPPELTPEQLAAVDRSRVRALDEAVARMLVPTASPDSADKPAAPDHTHCQNLSNCDPSSCPACEPTVEEVGEAYFSQLHDNPAAFLLQFDTRDRTDQESIVVAIAAWGRETATYVGLFIARSRARALACGVL